MLRRKPDDTLELRIIESMLVRHAPARLSDDRKMVLLDRIMQSLGEQQPTRADRLSALVQTRWVVIPAGVGLAAAIAAAVAGPLDLVNESGQPREAAPAAFRFEGARGAIDSGELVFASEHSWITYGSEVRVGMEQGATLRLRADSDAVHVDMIAGDTTFSTTGKPIRVYGSNWSALLGAGGVARFSLKGGMLTVEAFGGDVTVNANGRVTRIAPGAGPITIGDEATETSDAVSPVVPPALTQPLPVGSGNAPAGSNPGGSSATNNGNGNGNGQQPGNGASHGGNPHEDDDADGDGAAANPPETPPEPQGNAYGHETPPGQGETHGSPPSNPGNNGNGEPPVLPGEGSPPTDPGGDHGAGTPPADPGMPPVDPGTPPVDPGPGTGNGMPPVDPGQGNGNGPPSVEAGEGNGNGTPPEEPGSHGNGNNSPPVGPGNNNGNGSPPGEPGSSVNNGSPPGSSSGNGNGHGNGNGNGNGNS